MEQVTTTRPEMRVMPTTRFFILGVLGFTGIRVALEAVNLLSPLPFNLSILKKSSKE